jgi:hypothetical protein
LKKPRLLAGLALVLLVSSRAASGQERPDPPAFLGETLRYTMSILGVVGGEMTLSAQQAELDGRPAYKFELSAISNAMLSKIFFVRDFLASWVDPEEFRSIRFEKHTVEGKRVRDERIDFDYEAGLAHRDGKTIPIEGRMLDALSSVYYLRTIDLNGGDPPIIRVVAKRAGDLRVEVQARERIKTPAGTFSTVRIEPKTHGDAGLIGKGKNLVIWLTEDERRIPVQIKSKLNVGTLMGRLKSVERAEK